MPLETFEIHLDNPHRSYFAGQNVSGQVVIGLTERSKLIHGIKLKLQGKAKTHWKETSGRSTTHFAEEEVYIDEKVYLVGYETDSSEMTLETGNYKYQFNFLLPDSLPSSYCHKYGEVKYFVEATISRNRKPNYVSKVAFTVNGILDLNKESEAAREGEMSNEKVVCCFCCASGPLGFHFKLPKKGFVPGERIGFQIHMFNHSSRHITCTAVALIQELKFTADLERTKTKSVQMAQVEGPKLSSGDSTDWIVTSDVSMLKVPSVPPSRLDGCKIIDIGYHIKFKMEAKDSATLKECLPIVIGTIPLRDDFNQIDGVQRIPIISQPTSTPASDAFFLASYADLPPPTYEEAINGTKAEDAESSCSDPPDYGSVDWKSFIPRYVSYRFSAK
ncbi:arrestin domain-containing protein 17 [Folsomia candida]|nr:arrestin domain-containing protein 17 [Folsomia candida]XP_035709350.1 arrestin domain-containing protein 17 [Folsomia candida]